MRGLKKKGVIHLKWKLFRFTYTTFRSSWWSRRLLCFSLFHYEKTKRLEINSFVGVTILKGKEDENRSYFTLIKY